MRNCLLLGRKASIVGDVKDGVEAKDVELFGGTSLDDVQNVFAQNQIDVVIMGAGLDLELRLAVVKFVFENSKSTTLHMKDWNSGPAGMLPFVNGVLNGTTT
ncbi:MAG: hypothetical protein ACPGU4_03830 [Flavobacteriales bacterium]